MATLATYIVTALQENFSYTHWLKMPKACDIAYQFNNLALDDHYTAFCFIISYEAFKRIFNHPLSLHMILP